jgi:hypothetical protein
VFGLTQFDLASIARVLICFGVDGFVSLEVVLVLELDLTSFETVLLFPLLEESEKKSPLPYVDHSHFHPSYFSLLRLALLVLI